MLDVVVFQPLVLQCGRVCRTLHGGRWAQQRHSAPHVHRGQEGVRGTLITLELT